MDWRRCFFIIIINYYYYYVFFLKANLLFRNFINHYIIYYIYEGVLTPHNLALMEDRAKKMQVPVDIGRIPYKIATGEGFSRFTADQWKTFILVYATSITWDLLCENDQWILTYFVRACSILVSRIVSKGNLEEAHRCLLKMVKLIEEIYGSEKITPNLHLCLHICECVMDYGPLYAFWCFSYERMNGLVGKLYLLKIAG